jgi:hypothetical protein
MKQATTKPTATPTAPTTSTPSAANDLTAYFAAATDIDQRLKTAAAAANADIGTTLITGRQTTLAAIAAADPSSAARLIPAGLTPDVLLPVLTIQSDLVSRFYAFRGFPQAFYVGGPSTIPRTEPQPNFLSPADYLLICLGNGSRAAALFPADLAKAETAAAHAPPAVTVDPSSHTAADLAIWLQEISGWNSGCGSCGGARFTTLDTITWHYIAPLTPGGNPWDGDVQGGDFAAHYSAGQGWTIQLNAC